MQSSHHVTKHSQKKKKRTTTKVKRSRSHAYTLHCKMVAEQQATLINEHYRTTTPNDK